MKQRPICLLAGITVPLFACAWARPQAPARGKQIAEIDTSFLRDYAETRGYSMGRPARVTPTPDGKAVLFLRSTGPRSPVMHLFEFDVETRKTRELLTPEQLLKGEEENLSPEEKARRERQRVRTSGFTSFQMSADGSVLLLSLGGKLYTYNRKNAGVHELATGKGTLLDPKLSSDGKHVAYVLDYDVYVMDLETRTERRLTYGGTEDVSHGLAEFVAQEEMERSSGYWWSPDSQWIAYEEADAREVETWRAFDPASPGQRPHPQRYPRPGKNNVVVRLGIIPAQASGSREAAVSHTTWVDWDSAKYPYLASVKWQKGGPLTILVQARSQQEELLLAVDAKTGKTTELLKETDPAWINIDQDMPRWLSDGSGFLWTTERRGGMQLELRNAKGELVRELTPPSLGYHRVAYQSGLASVDEKNRRVYFRACPNPTEIHLCRASLEGGKPERLSEELGLHAAEFAENHSISVRATTGPKAMSRSTVHRADGSLIAELPSVAEKPPFVPNTEFVKVQAKPAPAVEGNDSAGNKGLTATARLAFYCSLTRPRSFDANKRYPVILDIYAGPGFRVVYAAMANSLQEQWLADQGFIVVSIDGRGTPGRGRDWERAIYRNFGQMPLDDQVAALQALGAKYPELDLERVGINGWSFGGYMAALGVLRRPDVFRAGVAGAPVTDWEDYDTHYTERYLGLPKENPEGYKASSLLTYAKDLKRPLLLIHGTGDDNVFFRHTLKLSDALFRAGREHNVLPMVGATHAVADPAARERLQEAIVRFFRKHL